MFGQLEGIMAKFPLVAIATGDVVQDSPLVDILPTDTAVYLYNVTLTFVG